MIDADLKDITECFNAPPAAANVDTPRLWRAIQTLRAEEREQCAKIALMVSESFGRHPGIDGNSRAVAQQVAALIEAAILQRGEK